MVRGMVTTGTQPAPIKLYEGPTGRIALSALKASNAALSAAAPGGDVTRPDGTVSGQEGNSLGNVSRGDRTPIELFLEGLADWDSKTMHLTGD